MDNDLVAFIRAYCSPEIIASIEPKTIQIEPIKPTINKGDQHKKDKALYYRLVWKQTEANAHEIKDIHKRGFKNWHIDHIVPISYGFKHSIPAYLIGGVSNLRMLYYKNNMLKNSKLTEDAKNILELWCTYEK